MPTGYRRRSTAELDPVADKPGTRHALSEPLGIDAFNLNVATLEPGERLSQNHYHYHEDQTELCHVAEGRCRVEVRDGGFPLGAGETVVFEAGEAGVHVVHNPADRPCRVLAIGWPPAGRYPVHQVRTLEAVLAERYGGEPPAP